MIKQPTLLDNDPLQVQDPPREDVNHDISINNNNSINLPDLNNNITTDNNLHYIDNNPLTIQPDIDVNKISYLPSSLQIATHNIRGTLGHLSVQVAITSFMTKSPTNKSQIDILSFAHTGLTLKQSKYAFTYSHFQEFQPYFAATNDPSYQFSGVGFLIRSSFAKYVKQSGHLKVRVIFVDLYLKGKTRLRIIQIYASHRTSPYYENDTEPMIKYINNLLSPPSSFAI